MYFVIAGCGDVGAQIAGTLADKGHNVVIIDRDQTAFERLSPLFDGNAVWGNAIDLDVQRKSGVEKADVFIAVTENDNANLMAAQMAKKMFNVNNVVARVSRFKAKVPESSGIRVVSLVNLESKQILGLINNKRPNQCACWQLRGAAIRKVRFSEKAYGKRVEEIQVPGHLLISLVMHNGEPETIPGCNTVIREGDLAVISVKESYVKKAAKWFSDLSEGGL